MRWDEVRGEVKTESCMWATGINHTGETPCNGLERQLWSSLRPALQTAPLSHTGREKTSEVKWEFCNPHLNSWLGKVLFETVSGYTLPGPLDY